MLYMFKPVNRPSPRTENMGIEYSSFFLLPTLANWRHMSFEFKDMVKKFQVTKCWLSTTLLFCFGETTFVHVLCGALRPLNRIVKVKWSSKPLMRVFIGPYCRAHQWDMSRRSSAKPMVWLPTCWRTPVCRPTWCRGCERWVTCWSRLTRTPRRDTSPRWARSCPSPRLPTMDRITRIRHTLENGPPRYQR